MPGLLSAKLWIRGIWLPSAPSPSHRPAGRCCVTDGNKAELLQAHQEGLQKSVLTSLMQKRPFRKESKGQASGSPDNTAVLRDPRRLPLTRTPIYTSYGAAFLSSTPTGPHSHLFDFYQASVQALLGTDRQREISGQTIPRNSQQGWEPNAN